MTKNSIDDKIKPKVLSVTEKVKRLLFDITRGELSKELSVTAKTLNVRLKKHNWTYEEKLIIDELSK